MFLHKHGVLYFKVHFYKYLHWEDKVGPRKGDDLKFIKPITYELKHHCDNIRIHYSSAKSYSVKIMIDYLSRHITDDNDKQKVIILREVVDKELVSKYQELYHAVSDLATSVHNKETSDFHISNATQVYKRLSEINDLSSRIAKMVYGLLQSIDKHKKVLEKEIATEESFKRNLRSWFHEIDNTTFK